MTSHREIESKFDVPAGLAMPELAGLPGVASVDRPIEHDLEAVYLDTPELALARARITLRRRTGGADAGWHLKLPVALDERTEVHAPLGAEGEPVPEALAAAVRARVRGAALAPVATLHTRRTVRVLRDPTGAVLAEVADDAVTSRAPGADGVHLESWREWEVELVTGDRGLLAAAAVLLSAAGAASSDWPSKLARALGDRLGERLGDHLGATTETAAGEPGSAGAVLGDFLRSRRDALLARDPQVRRDEPDAVHQMRVATRQLRSALTTFGPLFSDDRSDDRRGELRVELGWLAGLLGVARDAEVSRARLAELVAAEPAELTVGPVAQRLDDDRAAAYRAGVAGVLAAMDSPRYFGLLDALDAFVDDPPFTPLARGKAATVLPERVRRDANRLARAVRTARKAPPGPARADLLHEARKAAKRARYSGELVTPAVGRPAMRFARAAEKLADLLGRHHDTVVLREVLVRVSAAAATSGESTFTYGRLHALEQVHAEQIEEQLPHLWEQVSARRGRRWLR